MAIISIEIGGQTVRAMYRTRQVNPTPIELGDSVGHYLIPSAFAKDGEGVVHVGNDALRWKYDSEFNNITVIENDEKTYVKCMHSLLDLVVGKAIAQSGENVDRIVMVVPNYYGNNDPRKTCFKNAAIKLGVYNVDFVSVHEALCSRQAYIDDSKYVIVFDMGHLGTNLSLLQRKGSKFVFVATKRIEGVGGFGFDGFIYRDIMKKCAPVMPDDELCATLVNDELERISSFVKEVLSTNDVYHCPIPCSNTNYEVTRNEFEDELSSVLGPVYSACQNLVNDCNVNKEDVSEVLLWGGSCRIPFVLNRCKYLFKQINSSMKITNCTTMPDSCFMACDGGLIGKNNSSVTISF